MNIYDTITIQVLACAAAEALFLSMMFTHIILARGYSSGKMKPLMKRMNHVTEDRIFYHTWMAVLYAGLLASMALPTAILISILI